MLSYIVRRVLLAIPVLLGLLVVTFFLVRLIPGEPCSAMLGERATAEACEAFNVRYGLDQPIPVQLAVYVRNILQGDLGFSLQSSRPVTQVMIDRMPLTVELTASALVIAVAAGIPLGLLSARRHNSLVDVSTMTFANIGVSMPVFWLGLLLQYLFALILKDTFLALPPSGRLSAGVIPVPFYDVWGWTVTDETFGSGVMEFVSRLAVFNALITANWTVLWDAIRHLILPAMALATIPLAIIARITRSALLEVLSRDYIRTARAKGAMERRVVAKHAFRNAMLPVVTIVGLQLGLLLGGAVLTETVFNLSGVGKTLFEAITARDYAVIQGFVAVIASGYVIINLLVDISYGWLDPRIRYE
ncbi:MAG TPA: ABC transporter permease [Acidimicrobiia bacterium]|nr:ABC transporter permease [Acidimicrobiia bacterium]